MAGDISEPEPQTVTTTTTVASAPDVVAETGKVSNNDLTNGTLKVEEKLVAPAPSDPQAHEPLYFTKDGKVQFGITPPTAFAISYPYPPLPSNLAKNRVLRALDDHSKESLQEGITQAEEEFQKDAMPLPGLAIEGIPLKKVLIPEIELALYWDRHPFEFRPPEKDTTSTKSAECKNNNSKKRRNNARNSSGRNTPSLSSASQSTNHMNNNNNNSQLRRAKSEQNLASKVGEILKEENSSGRRTLSSATSTSNKSSHSDTSTIKKLSHHQHDKELAKSRVQSPSSLSIVSSHSANNHCAGNGQCHTNSSNGGVVVASSNINNKASALIMSESERKKFADISRPKLIRTQDQLSECSKKSAGVQVTLDEVTAAALKSTYLCPLHGQYQRGVERRDRGGFRTDMGSINVHQHCSRALKGIPSRTKLIKTAETQTDDELPGSSSRKHKRRSKTAEHRPGARGKDPMLSEYHGSFRNPYKIADSEKRHLRNKILSYCFTKHSIF